MRTDALMWQYTTRGLRLFLRAAFAGLDPDRQPAGRDDRVVCFLYSFGAIASAAELGWLPPFARRRCELVFLRRTYGAGFWSARRLRRDLHRRARQPHGRIAFAEGRNAVVEWLRGVDPALRLQELIDRMPAEQLPERAHGRAPFRRRATVTTGAPARARR